jgi:hypothetical protein
VERIKLIPVVHQSQVVLLGVPHLNTIVKPTNPHASSTITL